MATNAFYTGHRGTVRARSRVGIASSSKDAGTANSTESSATAKANIHQEERPNEARIVAADLYPDSKALSPILFRALTLPGQAIQFAEEGINLRSQDAIIADLRVQSLRPVLRKLFMCREIGDGFATIIDSLISGLDNNCGMPLDEARFAALHNTLLKLRDEPFLSFISATCFVEDIERAGFSTEPPGFEHLADWLTV